MKHSRLGQRTWPEPAARRALAVAMDRERKTQDAKDAALMVYLPGEQRAGAGHSNRKNRIGFWFKFPPGPAARRATGSCEEPKAENRKESRRRRNTNER